MALTTSLLKQKIQALKNANNKSALAGEWPNCVFPPEGTHRGRFIIDPNGDIYNEYWSIGYFNKGIRDPRSLSAEELPEGFDKENFDLLQLSNILTQDYHKWGRGFKKNFLCYFYLIETDSKTDKWQPGNLYCLIGNKKFGTAFNNLMTGFEDMVEELVTIFDPEQASKGSINMQITSGAQGTVSLSYVPKKSDPILPRDEGETDESYKGRLANLGYRPLDVSYIRPGWNQEKYDALVKSYKEELAELSGNKTEDEETPPFDEPKEEHVSTPDVEVKETPKFEEPKTIPPVKTDDPFAKFRRK